MIYKRHPYGADNISWSDPNRTKPYWNLYWSKLYQLQIVKTLKHIRQYERIQQKTAYILENSIDKMLNESANFVHPLAQ